jgi:hypothetical protein
MVIAVETLLDTHFQLCRPPSKHSMEPKYLDILDSAGVYRIPESGEITSAAVPDRI